jgi:hypothetical protein
MRKARVSISRPRSARKLRQLYLDTTILYSGYFGHELEKAQIAKATDGMTLTTSRYVFTEARNHVLTFIELYFIIAAERNIANAAAIVASRRRPRMLQRGLVLIASLVDVDATKVKRLAAVSNLIMGYIEYWEDRISTILDAGLGCPLARVSFSREPGLTTSEVFDRFSSLVTCVIEDAPKCKSDAFRAANSYKIELVRADTSLSSEGAEKIQTFLNKLEPHGALPHARGLKYRCSKIGDLLIALQCPAGSRVLTLDCSFRDLCRILKREVTVLPSLASLVKG